MKIRDITTYLETFFPLSLQEPWDMCGLQIGSLNQAVSKVMVGLNADQETIQKAIDENCDMLITHHPFMLEKIEAINAEHYHGKCIQMALANNLTVYSLHTCLDKGQNGISMNHWLLEALGVKDIESYDTIGIGKKGILPKAITVEQWIENIKKSLSLKHIHYTRGSTKKIQKIAICGGSGADDIEHLYKQVDCYITGDTKHRHGKFAIDHGILLVDIHHHSEVIMEKKVAELLQDLSVEVVIANSEDYYIYQ